MWCVRAKGIPYWVATNAKYHKHTPHERGGMTKQAIKDWTAFVSIAPLIAGSEFNLPALKLF
jgi:hypothetical protein